MKRRLARFFAIMAAVFVFISAYAQGVVCNTAYANKYSNRKTLRVGFFAFDGYHMIDSEGSKSGYGYDFIQMLSRYIDVDFEYIGYENSWDDMDDMLLQGKIDLVTSAQKTYDRTEKFAFSKAMGKSSAILTVKNDNNDIIELEYKTYDGMKIGMLEGNSRNGDLKKYAAEKGFSYTPIYYNMHEDMEKALQDGTIDAILTSSLRKTSGERILDAFDTREFYVMCRKDDTVLIDEINYAIDQLNAAEGDWQNILENKYYTHENNKYLDFTEREKEIIKLYSNGKNKLVVSACVDKKPYVYEENGEMKGILPDYFAHLAKYIGVEYEFIVPSSREEYMNWCEENKMDISLDGRFLNGRQIEDKKRTVTPVYTVMRLAVVTRRDFDGSIKKLAVARAQGSFDIEKNFVKDAEQCDFPTRELAMKAVLDGKADATVVYLYTAQQFVNRDESGLLTYNILSEPTYDYHLAFTPNVPHSLAGIFTKAMYAMPDGLFEEIASQYTTYKAESVDLMTWIKIYPLHTFAVCMIIFLLCIFVVLFYEKRKRALALYELADKAEKANLAKSEFLANVSHDIRTPMNAIVGIANLMSQEKNISERLKEYIQKLTLSSKHLLGIITDVLDMSKIEANEVVLSEDTFVMSEQIEQIEDILSPQTLANNQILNANFSKISHNYLIGDSARLRRVLINILSNAVKYTPSGGTIDFDIEELGWNTSTAKFKFTISDTGIGMSQKLMNRVFEPFTRGEGSVTNKVQGTGLGMSIAKSIVDLMGGDISVSSIEGEGTTVIVTVDIKIDFEFENKLLENQSKRLENDDKFTLDGLNFLCAEDNALNAEVLAETLKLYNATCTICSDGKELAEKFETSALNEYDAIITDIQMPNMNGLEAAKKIRNSKNIQGKTIPIIAMTANAFTEDIKSSISSGMDAHIAKPIDIAALEKVLKRLLNKKNINNENLAKEEENDTK